MRHSIVIPHRGREPHLKLCLDRLGRVINHRGSVEVIVVNEGSDRPDPSFFAPYPFCKPHWVRRPGTLFNKPFLQNLGIEHSTGTILSFIDADTLVGDRFLQAAEFALSPRLTKVCYRVRVLPDGFEVTPQTLKDAFDGYETFLDWVHEGYGDPAIHAPGGIPVFGNSHFSISRAKLGGLRFDERFEGAGFEDLAMNLAIQRVYGDNYQALIFTNADHAMFTVYSTREEDWWNSDQNARNRAMYKAMIGRK